MDPFGQVEDDCKEQVKNLDKFLAGVKANDISVNEKLDFENQIGELNETIEDLKDAIEQIESKPEMFEKVSKADIEQRQEVIRNFQGEYRRINDQWNAKNGSGTTNNPFLSYEDANNNEIHSTEIDRNVLHQQQQEEFRYQDEQLDSVYDSVQRINQQAQMMGTELEDQSHIIGDFEQDIDRTKGRINGAVKKVNHILAKNRSCLSDCCILVLIVVLIILFVLILIV